MAYRVLISDNANEELDSAVKYIAMTLGAPGTASSLINEFEENLPSSLTTPGFLASTLMSARP